MGSDPWVRLQLQARDAFMSTTAHDFHALTVAEVRGLTLEAATISLAVPEALRPLFAFRPGQHVNVRACIGGEEVRRSYSICSGPGERHLTIGVKRVAGGLFSVWANDALRPGATVDVMPPQGRFVLAPPDGTARHVLLLAAGSGITPVLAMLRHALVAEKGTRLTLVYGNRTPADVMFAPELDDLKDRHLDRLTLVHVHSRGGGEDGAGLAGRIGADLLGRLDGRLLRMAEVAHAYVCGPGTMIRECRDALLALGLPRERVHHEFFAAAGGANRRAGADAATGGPAASAAPARAEAGSEVHGAEIEAILDGQRHRFPARPGEAVIDAALRAGVRAPYSCKGGMCSTCRTKVVEGTATMRVNYSLEPWETEKGFVLACQAVAGSPRLVLDFDQM